MDWINQIPFSVWYAIGGAVLALVVSAAHARGARMPILEALLNWVQQAKPSLPAAPAAPAPGVQPVIGDGHLLRELQAFFAKLQATAPADKPAASTGAPASPLS